MFIARISKCLYQSKAVIAVFASAALLSGCGGGSSDSSSSSSTNNTIVYDIPTPAYPIIDTGQVLYYDDSSSITEPLEGAAYYGQDAHFSGNQFNYTTSADGKTVFDNISRLTWTQTADINGDATIDADDKLTYSAAQSYANTLNASSYGGYSDWRLPSMKELYSLMDFTGEDPSGAGTDTSGFVAFIDRSYFGFDYGDQGAGERAIDAQFWSSNAYVDYVFGSESATFGLNLADGRIKGYPNASSGPSVKTCYVYFVRGNPSYGINDFTDNADGTVTDSATGLMWAQDDSGAGMNWQNALAWVATKNTAVYLGYDDWRLPNAKELQSIIDYSRSPATTSSAAINAVFNATSFTNENGQTDYPWYWSGTTHATNGGGGTAAVYLCFGRALGYMSAWLDVHGAGCQRSDPKSGSLSSYTYVSDGYYHSVAPQGDAIRINNYVRLVRDVGVSSTVKTVLSAVN